MKQIKSMEVISCDYCGEGGCYYKCMNCGADMCYTCLDKYATRLEHGVFCSGSGDGHYCHKCANDSEVQKTPLFQSYQKIKKLRDELSGFQSRFAIERKEAEAECEAQYEIWKETKKGTV